LRSKVKVSWRSLRNATHRLMVMHPHTKYNWPIWKDKKCYGPTSFAEKKQKKKINMSPFVRKGDIITIHTVAGHFQLFCRSWHAEHFAV
jgi:hypothetical protein